MKSLIWTKEQPTEPDDLESTGKEEQENIRKPGQKEMKLSILETMHEVFVYLIGLSQIKI